VDIFTGMGLAEVILFFEIELRITGFSRPGCPELFPERNTVHFTGTSVGRQNYQSTMRGRVEMTSEGEVHWQLVFTICNPIDVSRPVESDRGICRYQFLVE
jgi:hypothetical protein